MRVNKMFTLFLVILLLSSLVYSAALDQISGVGKDQPQSKSNDDKRGIFASFFGFFSPTASNENEQQQDVPQQQTNPETTSDEGFNMPIDVEEGEQDTEGKIEKGKIASHEETQRGRKKSDVKCEDTDRGRDFTRAGVVTGKISLDGEVKTIADRCIDENTLVEAFCNPWTDLVQFNKVYCPNGCVEELPQTPGGRLGNQPQLTSLTVKTAKCISPPYCLDTDRKESNKIRGYLLLFKSGSLFDAGSIAELNINDRIEAHRDYCDPNDRTKVIQHKCSVDGYEEVVTNCGDDERCRYGVCCKKEECPPLEESKDSGDVVIENPQTSSIRHNSAITTKSTDANGEQIEITKGQTKTVNGVRLKFDKDGTLSYDLTIEVGKITDGILLEDDETDKATNNVQDLKQDSTPSSQATSLDENKDTSSQDDSTSSQSNYQTTNLNLRKLNIRI
ncbi:hypothetical protein D6777_01875 [Candidatus Woesearchaeota archaeon]|nr:MAG: hypothetical protein D6777_01875 [Candidatus Woesearchaeota archaeon]